MNPAAAQSSQRPAISVPPSLPAELTKPAPFPILVTAADAVPLYSFVMIRGLPETAELSEGASTHPGTWVVPISKLPLLTVTLRGSQQDRSEVTVSLVAADGFKLSEAKTVLLAVSSSQSQATAPPGGDARAPVMTPDSRSQALRLLQKGTEELEQGNVAPARSLYERAALLGLPEAAIALAETYDPTEVARTRARNVKPDPKEARRWYERARQLGVKEADQRLQRLGTN